LKADVAKSRVPPRDDPRKLGITGGLKSPTPTRATKATPPSILISVSSGAGGQPGKRIELKIKAWTVLR
jgi:hypothetical protein